MALIVLAPELLGRFVELNLGCLGLSDLVLELVLLARHLNCEFLDLEVEFFDLSFVSSTVLLHSQGVFLLLPSSQNPLLKLFLVPVHLQL